MPPVVPVVLNNMEEPVHKVVGPLMVPATAAGFTVTVKEAEDAPQILVTV